MYKRMLVPLDGSRLAEIVLPYARELAGRLDLEMVLLHVCELQNPESNFMCQSYIDHAAEIVMRQSREIQTSTGAGPGGKLAEAQGKVAAGNPAEEIIRYAAENNIDFMLMATHGQSGVRRWLLGSVVDKVLRASTVPVWLVRANISKEIVHDEWPNQVMLVPLDGSKPAESVLPHVETLAKQRGAEMAKVILIRVVEEPLISSDYPFPDWEKHVKQMKERYKEGAETYLDTIQKHLSSAGLDVRSEVLMGKPAEEIINYANKVHPSLVVMATHGRSQSNRWQYGSIANKVLYGLPGSMFMVRPS